MNYPDWFNKTIAEKAVEEKFQKNVDYEGWLYGFDDSVVNYMSMTFYNWEGEGILIAGVLFLPNRTARIVDDIDDAVRTAKLRGHKTVRAFETSDTPDIFFESIPVKGSEK